MYQIKGIVMIIKKRPIYLRCSSLILAALAEGVSDSDSNSDEDAFDIF